MLQILQTPACVHPICGTASWQAVNIKTSSVMQHSSDQQLQDLVAVARTYPHTDTQIENKVFGSPPTHVTLNCFWNSVRLDPHPPHVTLGFFKTLRPFIFVFRSPPTPILPLFFHPESNLRPDQSTMKDTVDSSSINQTLTALDNYVLLGKSGLRVSPLSLGTMVCSQGSHVFRGNSTSRTMRSLTNSSPTLDYNRPLANNGYGKDFGNFSESILFLSSDQRSYCRPIFSFLGAIVYRALEAATTLAERSLIDTMRVVATFSILVRIGRTRKNKGSDNRQSHLFRRRYPFFLFDHT